MISTKERIGAPVRELEVTNVSECMLTYGLQDIKSSNNLFAWNNKQEGSHRVFSTLDIMVVNQPWVENFPSIEVWFHNEGEFNHTLALLTVYPVDNGGKKQSKYVTTWRTFPKFMEVQGTKMFKITKKLRPIKAELKALEKKGT